MLFRVNGVMKNKLQAQRRVYFSWRRPWEVYQAYPTAFCFAQRPSFPCDTQKPESVVTIVSQPSKGLKFMTFREGCFVICNWMQVLKWSSWDFLSPLILQKMKQDNISQLGDYDAPFYEQYRYVSCYILLFKFKSFDQLIPPKLPQILDIYSVVALYKLKWKDLMNSCLLGLRNNLLCKEGVAIINHVYFMNFNKAVCRKSLFVMLF